MLWGHQYGADVSHVHPFMAQLLLVLIMPTMSGCLGWVALGGWFLPRWFARLKMVIHLTANQARFRVTSLMETNVLPLSQITASVLCNRINHNNNNNVDRRAFLVCLLFMWNSIRQTLWLSDSSPIFNEYLGRDVVLETAILVSRPIETGISQYWSWHSWSWSWRIGLGCFRDWLIIC